jgi:uncharacterized membrane protein
MKPLADIILEVVETKQPKNVKDLIALVQKQVDNATVADITAEIKRLQKKQMISLEAPAASASKGFQGLMLSKKNAWFWATLILTILTFASVLLVPAEAAPLSYVRYLFGFIFVVFLPGYCLTETLFPKNDALDIIERLTLSVGLSFAVTALVGLFLSFSQIGLTLMTALPTLSLIVIVLALISFKRKYTAEK